MALSTQGGRLNRLVATRKPAKEGVHAKSRGKSLAERIPAVTYIMEIGKPSRIVYLSPQIEGLLGYPLGSYERDPWLWVKLLHPDDRERVLAADARASAAGEAFDLEYRCLTRDGRTIWIYDKATVTQDGQDGPLLREGLMLEVTDRKAFAEQLEHRALHDPLTGLANRTLFVDRLEHALRSLDRHTGSVAVLFIDLDDLKVVNDSSGHEAGDRLLVTAARRLRNCLRPEDTVARFGGDEFAILLNVTGAREARRVAERIVDVMKNPLLLEGREISVGASVGVAIGTSARDWPHELLKQADRALYEAKRKGKGQYCLFEFEARGEEASGEASGLLRRFPGSPNFPVE